MFSFGKTSKEHLATAHDDLQKIAAEAIKVVDHTILEGHRGKEAQNKAYREGRSKLQWQDGNHNAIPSRALDVAPYPIDWDSKHAAKKFAFLAGVYFGIAHMMKIKLRWGGDWDGDGQMDDQSFHDLPHIERKKE